MDVSRQTELKNRLSSETAKLKGVSKEIRTLSDYVLEQARQKELLDRKIRLHNSLGTGLTAVRSLIRENETDPREKLAPLKRTVDLMLGEADTDDLTDRLNDFLSDAAALGVRVELSGNLPANAEYADFFVTVMQELLSNGVRHSHADRITVLMGDNDAQCTLDVSCNSLLSEDEIVPRGGLLNIEAKVKQFDGQMTLTTGPQLSVRILLPSKKGVSL